MSPWGASAHYRINGVSAGNVNGAIHGFSMICAKYLKDYFNCEDALHPTVDPDAYYRRKLLATLSKEEA